MADATLRATFGWFQEQLQQEAEIRERIKAAVRDLEQKCRTMEAVLLQVHQVPEASASPVLAESRALFAQVQEAVGNLAATFPPEQYFRFNGHWRWIMQQACFLLSLQTYLETGAMLTFADAAAQLGAGDKFPLDLEDFLTGLCNVSGELARLATNSVTAGDTTRPQRIAAFLADLHTGFGLLNLKNDALRKRVDGLKYDRRRVEGILYDLSVRGLTRPAPA